MKTVKTYTIKEAIEKLDAIRMYANIVAKKLVKRQDEKLAALVSELASIMLWLTRHVDEFESEIISESLFDKEKIRSERMRKTCENSPFTSDNF